MDLLIGDEFKKTGAGNSSRFSASLTSPCNDDESTGQNTVELNGVDVYRPDHR